MSFKYKPHILDFQCALKATAGNEQLAHQLLTVFISQISDYQQNIKRDLDINNNEGLQNNIHKLNGALQYIGAPCLRLLVADLDDQINTCSRQDLSRKMTRILNMLAQIQHFNSYPVD